MSMVSVLSTSSVIVFPVRVLTKICIAEHKALFNMEFWGANFKCTEEVINAVWLSDMGQEEKDRCIRALRIGAASAAAMPECVAKYHGRSLLQANRLMAKESLSGQDYVDMEEKRAEAERGMQMLQDVVEKCNDVKERIMTDTFKAFVAERVDKKFVCPLSNKMIDIPLKIACGCTVDSDEFVLYLRRCEREKTVASCPMNRRPLKSFDYQIDLCMQRDKQEWLDKERRIFLGSIGR